MSKVSQHPQMIGYARVSTDKQTTDQQIYALRKAGCEDVYVDHAISATCKKRKGLEQARKALRQGDIFVVWAIDRAFRSTIDAILFLDELKQRDIAFQSLTQQIDTRTPEGRKWFIDTASWAEYERAIISRRTKEKMADAKRRGQHLGRPYVLKDHVIRKAYSRVTEGNLSIQYVAKQIGVSHPTLTRGFKRLGLST